MRHCPACHNLKVMGLSPLKEPDSSTHSSLCLTIFPHWLIIAELEPIFNEFHEEEVQFCSSILFRAVLTCVLLLEKYRIYRMLVASGIDTSVEVIDTSLEV